MTGGLRASGLAAVLHRHRVALAKESERLVPLLVAKGVLTGNEAAIILDQEENNNNNNKVDERGLALVKLISAKGNNGQRELCNALQILCPELLTTLLMDSNQEGSQHSRESSSQSNRDPDASAKCNNRDLELHRTASGSLLSNKRNPEMPDKSGSHEMKRNGKECDLVRVTAMHELLEEPVEETLSERVSWEFHHVQLQRVRGYGFGIAVSGGRDNPHFTNGDPSIAISDVLHSGPAEGKLAINDRIVSANGIVLDGVDYATAVQVLRDSGQTVSLVVKRRVINSHVAGHVTGHVAGHVGSHVVRLHRENRRSDFGLVLECKFFVKELHSVAGKEPGLEKGDLLHKINNVSLEGLSLKEVRKLIDKSDTKLELAIKRNTKYHRHLRNSEIERKYDSVSSTAMLTPSRPPPVVDEAGEFSRIQRLSHGSNNDSIGKQLPDPRYIRFEKSGSVGIRLTGGNEVGIFVTAVQPGSPASQQGLQPGDKILKVNDMDMKNVTREEAVLFLLSLEDHINIIAQMRKDDYENIVASQRGDSFYIKTHFNYEATEKNEMSFRVSDVFHVVDTLHNGVVGAWQVFKMDPFLSAMGRAAEQFEKGVIPNSTRAEEIAIRQFNDAKKNQQSLNSQQSSSGKGASAFFRRRRDKQARRSKSLGKDHWEDVVWSESVSKFPAYERVVLRHPNFARPLIIFGPVADIAREKLLNEFPAKYAAPQQDSVRESGSRSGIVRLSSIRSIMNKGKHALLDVTPNAVDKLNYAQLYPIVVFCHTSTKAVIKQCRSGLPKKAHLSSRKLLEQCSKLDRLWRHVFTASVELQAENWYDRLKEIVAQQQNAPIWMSENKPSESALSDDFLFPMSSHCRLSYASSPDSDGEMLEPDTSTMRSTKTTTTTTSSATSAAMARSTSDPNLIKEHQQKKLYLIAQQQEQQRHQQQEPQQRHQEQEQQQRQQKQQQQHQQQEQQQEEQEEQYEHGVKSIPNYHLTPPFAVSKLSMPSTMPSSMPSTMPASMPASLSVQRSPREETVLPHVPPRIDRQKKPSTGERNKMHTYNGHEDNELQHMQHRRRQTLVSHHFEQSGFANSNVSSNMNSNMGNMSNGMNGNMGNSMGSSMNNGMTNGMGNNIGNTMNNPISTMESSSVIPHAVPQSNRYASDIRYSEYKPVPPPKSASTYKPVPPPKPKSYPRSTSTPSSGQENNYMNAKHAEEENGFDSGQGSSLDRDAIESPENRNRKNFYFNINEAYRQNNGLDLSNREYRGSAFELYRKPMGQHYHNMSSLPPR